MKKLIIFGIAVLSIAIMAIAYYLSFPVRADGSNLEEHIDRFYNRSYSVGYSNDIKLYDSIILGKNKYVLVEIDEKLGVVTLVQGIIGGYKIAGLDYGSGNFREWIADSKDKKYLIFGGRNTSLEIASITFTLEGHNYSMDIPNKKRFFTHLEVDNRIQLTHLDLDSLKFYNIQGEDITEQVDWSENFDRHRPKTQMADYIKMLRIHDIIAPEYGHVASIMKEKD